MNPIAQRIAVLHDQWTEFAQDSQARLLRWLVTPDEVRTVEAFLQTEAHERGSTPDLFLRFATPFEQPRAHGHRLRDEFEAGYVDLQSDLRAAEFDADWVPPRPAPNADDVAAFAAVCRSFREFYEDLPLEHLVLVLIPSDVPEPERWVEWLDRLVANGLAPHVRAIVLDDARAPMLAGLADKHPRAIVSRVADLDIAGAMAEIARASGQHSASGRYRMKFLALGAAAAIPDLLKSERACNEACLIAAEQGWKHLIVPAKVAYGTAFVAAERPLDAVRVYREAERTALEIEEEGHSYGSALRLQCQLAIGSALIAAEAFAEAATSYEHAVPTAERNGNAVLLLECWRMAAYSHECANDWDRAWDCGVRALAVAQSMDAPTRASSALPYVGEGLMRLATRSPYDSQSATIELKMVELTGTREWRPTPDGSSSRAKPAR